MNQHKDTIFAPLDRDNDMVRVAGGNETEVYRTDDGRHVVKVKQNESGSIEEALEIARTTRAAAEAFADCLGPHHSIPSHYLISRDSEGNVQAIAIQPFIANARPLHETTYANLSAAERHHLVMELRDIIRRSLLFYRKNGSMPDLYGRTSRNKDERKRLNAPHMLPWRIWSFVVERNLLRSCNLMLTDETPPRVILIDYDPVMRGWLYRLIYYTVRWMLFWRDHVLLTLMQWGRFLPQASQRKDTT